MCGPWLSWRPRTECSPCAVAARVDRLDLEHVRAVSERSAVPVTGDLHPVPARTPRVILPCPPRVDAVEQLRGRDRLREVQCPLPRTSCPSAEDAPADHRRHHRLVCPLSRHAHGRLVPDLAHEIEASRQLRATDASAVALEAERVDRRACRIDVWGQCSASQGVHVTAVDELREVDVPPASGDSTKERLRGDGVLSVANGRDDVPVREDAASARPDGDRLGALLLPDDPAGGSCVDSRAVWGRDVDAEVKRLRLDAAGRRLADARVAEEAADGMLLVERLERPGIGRVGRCGRHERCECRDQHEAGPSPNERCG